MVYSWKKLKVIENVLVGQISQMEGCRTSKDNDAYIWKTSFGKSTGQKISETLKKRALSFWFL